MEPKTGDRVQLRKRSSTIQALWYTTGTIIDAEFRHEHSEGKRFMRFDEPVKHYARGSMSGCWVDADMIEEL